ncbi:MAG: hypothetical protein ABIR58_01060 [Gemmatimonadaceae bacterium]
MTDSVSGNVAPGLREPISTGLAQLFRRTAPLAVRQAAWRAIDKLPLVLQRRFSHTGEHRRFKMQQLYKQEVRPLPAAPTVLFWIPGGMPLLLHVETSIAAALRLRGYNVHAIICDSPYRACVRREATDGIPVEEWRRLCPRCIASNRDVLDVMGIPYSSVGDYVPEDIRAALFARAEQCTSANILELTHKGLKIGQNVVSAVTRYQQGSSAAMDDQILREYAYTALVCAEAAGHVMDRFVPSRVLMSHAVYVDWGPALSAAVSRDIPVTGWKASYLTARFFFRHVTDPDRIDFHNISDASWSARAAEPLTPEEDEALQTFLERRYRQRVSFDMRNLQRYTGETERFRDKYGVEKGKPVWGIMAHINWDSVSDYSPMAYASFDEWILDTVEQSCRTPEVQWLIKVHPAELDYEPGNGVQRLVERHFPDLPPNVKIIPADEAISPLEFFDLVDGGVTVYGTSGLELALAGKPVILAGEAHYGGRGFTEDGLSIDTYRRLLARAASIAPLSAQQTGVARRYAYSLFVQRQIPLPLVRDPASPWWALQHDKRELLLQGHDPFIDFICDRLMDGNDFIMNGDLITRANAS